MRIEDNKYFGILSGFWIGVGLTIGSFVLRTSLVYFKYIGQIPIYYGLIPMILMIALTLLNKSIALRTLNWLYLGIAIYTFIYLFSMLQWNVECCPRKYESMYDWNAAVGLSWMVYLPLAIIIVMIIGYVFDILRNQRTKQ